MAEVRNKKKTAPVEVLELQKIESLLSSFLDSAYMISVDASSITANDLNKYSSSTKLVIDALTLLNDYRRHFPELEKLSDSVMSKITSARGGDKDALSSEEIRILLSCKNSKQTILSVIQALEALLTHIRNTAHTLLSSIMLSEDDLHKSNVLTVIQPSWVVDLLKKQISAVNSLLLDLKAVFELEHHAKELSENA